MDADDYDCNKLNGRLRDLCRGYDADGNPVLTPEKRKQYRQFFVTGQYEEFPPKATARERRESREAERIAKSRAAWSALHAYASEHRDDWDAGKAKQWYRAWLRTIPNYGCGCRKKWTAVTAKLPPQFESSAAFYEWSVRAHNEVNAKLGKPIFEAGQKNIG